MNRRAFLNLSATAALFLLAACGGGSSNSKKSTNSDLANLDKKKSTLPIPKVLEGKVINGVRHYDLAINKAKHNFFDNVKSDTPDLRTFIKMRGKEE